MRFAKMQRVDHETCEEAKKEEEKESVKTGPRVSAFEVSTCGARREASMSFLEPRLAPGTLDAETSDLFLRRGTPSTEFGMLFRSFLPNLIGFHF
jgi:hypothetical protein